MACHQYFGCATLRNRFRWGMFATFLVMGVALLVMSVQYGFSGMEALLGCLQHDPDVRRMVGDGTFDDLTPEQRKEAVRICADHHPRLAQQLAATSACSWVGIFALVAASIPFYMMCCCTRAPAHAASGTVPVAEPAGEAAANPLRRGEEQQPLLSGRA